MNTKKYINFFIPLVITLLLLNPCAAAQAATAEEQATAAEKPQPTLKQPLVNAPSSETAAKTSLFSKENAQGIYMKIKEQPYYNNYNAAFFAFVSLYFLYRAGSYFYAWIFPPKAKKQPSFFESLKQIRHENSAEAKAAAAARLQNYYRWQWAFRIFKVITVITLISTACYLHKSSIKALLGDFTFEKALGAFVKMCPFNFKKQQPLRDVIIVSLGAAAILHQLYKWIFHGGTDFLATSAAIYSAFYWIIFGIASPISVAVALFNITYYIGAWIYDQIYYRFLISNY